MLFLAFVITMNGASQLLRTTGPSNYKGEDGSVFHWLQEGVVVFISVSAILWNGWHVPLHTKMVLRAPHTSFCLPFYDVFAF